MLFLKKNIWSLLIMVLVVIGCTLVVKAFKKPGQMTVIESQAMDMASMTPPPGAMPVGVSKVTKSLIEHRVIYSGTVQAFEDEDVYPRIVGRIVRMPIYPGDRVKKGELLVQLDAAHSEYKVRMQQALYAQDAAMHESGVAKSEFAEKKYQLEAAQAAEEAARKAIDESAANVAYWKPELEREEALLKAQVVSLDEFQKEAANLKAAEAKLAQDEAKLREATRSKLAAQAAQDMMMHHIGHQFASTREAKAAAENATFYEKYTRIVAQDDGVVTKRIISPGVLVNPGMLLLKLAHIRQVRVQAEVSSGDAEAIRVGNRVYIQSWQENRREKLVAKVTSIFPAADPSSRTITVEAQIDNVVSGKESETQSKGRQVNGLDHYRFLPGQYVVMEIVTAMNRGLVVPTNAIIWREGKAHVWRVVRGENGMLQCLLVTIKTGLAEPDRTEVLDGLTENDSVISAGYSNLQDQMVVVPTEWGASGPQKLPIAAEVMSNRLDQSNNWSRQVKNGELTINVSLMPPRSNTNTVVVQVSRIGGGIVSGAKVRMKTSMPGMNMPGPEITGATGSDGKAVLNSNLMSGLWALDLSIDAGEKPNMQTVLDVEVP